MAVGMKVRVYWDTAGHRMKHSARTENVRVKRSALNRSRLNKAGAARLSDSEKDTAPDSDSADEHAPEPKKAPVRKAVSLESGDESGMKSFVNEESETEG
ncbi:hypothetical protein RvY_16822 [Ramazzottius varieornatus]|uniref:Uncharacterized protein n=1 Tax=Ramazzottius varieornatus TaxID=947166 RepID=A0A1D1W2F4_RAMVA|nr:hypothetical protein RvY_16822 [Ramazzottius varieornatus]